MNVAPRIGWTLLAAVLGAMLAWQALRDREAADDGARADATRVTPPAVAARVPALPDPTPVSTRAPAAPVSRNLQAALMSAKDLRAFVLDAMKRPAEGGYFYAKHALALCGRDLRELRRLAAENQAKEIRTTGTIDPRKTALGERYFSECASFVPGETDEMLRTLKSLEGDGKDPLVVAQKLAIEASLHPEGDNLRAAAARLLELGDPLLLSTRNPLATIAAADREAREKMGRVFDGRVTGPQDGPGYVLAGFAMDLGSCTPSTPCEMDVELRITCAVSGKCRTREELIQSRLDEIGATAEDWQKVLAMADRVRQAMSSRNVSFFVR